METVDSSTRERTGGRPGRLETRSKERRSPSETLHDHAAVLPCPQPMDKRRLVLGTCCTRPGPTQRLGTQEWTGRPEMSVTFSLWQARKSPFCDWLAAS